MEVVQRNFREGDFSEIAEFRKESAGVSFPGCKFDSENFKNKFFKFLKREPEGVQVLERDDEIIGCICFSCRQGNFGKYGSVHYLFIKEGYRGRGFAGRLLNYAEKYFRSKGIKRIKLTVTETNLPAVRLYEKLNYKKTRLVMEKFL